MTLRAATDICRRGLSKLGDCLWESPDFFRSEIVLAFETLVEAQEKEMEEMERRLLVDEDWDETRVITPIMVLAASVSKLMLEWGHLRSEAWYRINEKDRHATRLERYMTGTDPSPPVDSLAFLMAMGERGGLVRDARAKWEAAVKAGDREGCYINPGWWRWFKQFEVNGVLCFRQYHARRVGEEGGTMKAQPREVFERMWSISSDSEDEEDDDEDDDKQAVVGWIKKLQLADDARAQAHDQVILSELKRPWV